MKRFGTYLATLGILLAMAIPAATVGASGHAPSVTQYQYWSLLSGAAQSAILRNSGQLPPSVAGHGGLGLPLSGRSNVEANDPTQDGSSLQFTQSETSVAISGSEVVVGFNDSTGYNAKTNTGCFTGYAYSTDGGASFTDGGCIPFPSGGASLGDPAVAADPNTAGVFYFGQLTQDAGGNEFMSVTKSSDGGKTWSALVAASPKVKPGLLGVPIQDKDWLSAGINPSNHSQTILYASWSHFSLTSIAIQVSRSTDGGTTWSAPFNLGNASGLNSVQGSNTTEDAQNGKVYGSWEQINGLGSSRSIVIRSSTDGGQTWSKAKTIATFSDGTNAKVSCSGKSQGVIEFKAGDTHHVARNLDLPSGTVDPTNHNVYITFNAKVNGKVNIELFASSDGGTTWKGELVAKSAQVQYQPWVSADNQGVHVEYYQLNSDGTFSEAAANGNHAVPPIFSTPFQVSDMSFSPAQTNPQNDPVIAPCYMGDYNQLTSDGNFVFYVWGDYRNYSTTGPDVWTDAISG